MPVEILHVGMPKTGTTALQHALEQVNLLREADARWAAAVASVQLSGPDLLPAPHVIHPLSDTGIVVSSENLTLCGVEHAIPLCLTLQPEIVVMTHRPFHELLESRWTEQVMCGLTETFETWSNEWGFSLPQAEQIPRWWRPDYVNAVWLPDLVLPYSANIIQDFADTLLDGIPLRSERVNTSLSGEGTECVRLWQKANNGTYEEVRAIAARVAERDYGKRGTASSDYADTMHHCSDTIEAAMLNDDIADVTPIRIHARPLDNSIVRHLLQSLE